MTPSNAKHLKSALQEALPPEERAQAAECQLCHQILPNFNFYLINSKNMFITN